MNREMRDRDWLIVLAALQLFIYLLYVFIEDQQAKYEQKRRRGLTESKLPAPPAHVQAEIPHQASLELHLNTDATVQVADSIAVYTFTIEVGGRQYIMTTDAKGHVYRTEIAHIGSADTAAVTSPTQSLPNR